MFSLKARAEHYLGAEIPPAAYEDAERSARRKLDWIIERYGPEGHDDEYLAILVSEFVRLHSFQAYLEVRNLELEIEREVANNPVCQKCGKCGQRKTAPPTSEKQPNYFDSTLIISPLGSKVKTKEAFI